MEAQRELAKVSTWYSERQLSASEKWKDIKTNLEHFLSFSQGQENLFVENAVDSYLLVLRNFGEELTLLSNFAKLNCTGFQKIMAKHDRKLSFRISELWIPTSLEPRSLFRQQICGRIEYELQEKVEVLKHEKYRFLLAAQTKTRQKTIHEYLYGKGEYTELIKQTTPSFEGRHVLVQIARTAAADDNETCLRNLIDHFFGIGHEDLLFGEAHHLPTLLHLPTHEATVNAILKMLDQKASPEILKNLISSYDSNGNHLIHNFCTRGFHTSLEKLFEILEKHKITLDIDQTNRDRCTPLLAASRAGHLKCVEILFSKGTPDTAKQDIIDKSPVHMACAPVARPAVLRYLIKMDQSQLEYVDGEKKTAFLCAIKYDQLESAKILVDEFKVKGTEKDINGRTCFHHAVLQHHIASLEWLLKQDQFVSIRDEPDVFGKTPLHYACQNNFEDCIQLLVTANCSLQVQDQNGFTPCCHSAWVGNLKVAQQLHTKADEPPPEVVNVTLQSPSQQQVSPELTEGVTPSVTRLVTEEAEPNNTNNKSNSNNNTTLENNNTILENNNSTLENNNTISENNNTTLESNNTIPENKTSNNEVGKHNLYRPTQFVIRMPSQVGTYVAVVGNRTILGRWDEKNAIPMLKTEEGASEDTWCVTINIPTVTPVTYKYIVCLGRTCLQSESTTRSFTVQPSDSVYLRDDGQYGVVNPESQHKARLVHSPCLKEGLQLRLTFNKLSNSVINSAMIKGQPITVVTTTKEIASPEFKASLPSQRPQEIIFNGADTELLLSIRMTVFLAGTGLLLGRAALHPRQFEHCSGTVTGTIMNTQLEEVGAISVEYFIATAFPDSRENEGLMLRTVAMDPWQSTLIVGHRGSGSKTSSLVGKHHRTHVQENTILSFVSASYNVNFIEFDVQLTRDNVPVIYHDFSIPTPEGWRVPINMISLEDFKRYKLKRNDQTAPKVGSLQDDSTTLTRSKSWNKFQSPADPTPSTKKKKAQSNILDNELPTLQDCFERVPLGTGFNVEIKFDPRAPTDPNKFIDTILQVVAKFAGKRTLIFSSFHPHICLLLRLKQQRYPVFFLNHGGTNCADPYPAGNSLEYAVQFAKKNELTGIVVNSMPLIVAPKLISTIKKTGLILFTYGAKNNDPDCVDLQEALGVDGVICDHLQHVKRKIRFVEKMNTPRSVNRKNTDTMKDLNLNINEPIVLLGKEE